MLGFVKFNPTIEAKFNFLSSRAENERMHLLIWMQVIHPSKLERFLVMAAQGFYVVGYGLLYALR